MKGNFAAMAALAQMFAEPMGGSPFPDRSRGYNRMQEIEERARSQARAKIAKEKEREEQRRLHPQEKKKKKVKRFTVIYKKGKNPEFI